MASRQPACRWCSSNALSPAYLREASRIVLGSGARRCSAIKWRESRVALVVTSLALLATGPAVLASLHAKNPWEFGSVTAAAGVVAAFGAVWQARYLQIIERRGEQAFRTEDGCLLLVNGKLPKVRDLTDPIALGVHKASAAALAMLGQRGDPVVREHIPVYVPRDIDDDLRASLRKGGFVLLVGDSTAGKSRAAFEVMTATLADHVLVCPAERDAIATAVSRAAQARRCVLWLDDLERFLGIGGLNVSLLARLVTADKGHQVILATMRSAERARITFQDEPSVDDSARHVRRDARQVIEQAQTIRVPRMFSGPELERARARAWDSRVAQALDHSDTYGVAEYMAAGPELLHEWEDARTSSSGPNARGAALVAAAIDIRRAGYISPIPRTLLDQVHEVYLDDTEHSRVPRESVQNAWDWAVRYRNATTSLLQAVANGRVVVFDYLVDAVQRRCLPGDQVPEVILSAAIDFADPADADSIGELAIQQGRYGLAEHAYRKALRLKEDHPDFGSEHLSTLTSREYRALSLRLSARREESEAEHRAISLIRTRLLGNEHPSTLTSRDYHARSLHSLGRLDEAEAEHREVLQIRTRVLSEEHPNTLQSMINCAGMLRERGRLQEAEAAYDGILRVSGLVLGEEHPDTLLSRHNRAIVLRAMGRLQQAEAEFRSIAAIQNRILGDEHPDTLHSRDNRAIVLRRLGRLAEAEAEVGAVLQIRTKVLGPEHPDTLRSRNNRAVVLRAQGQLQAAEAELNAVIAIFSRLLGDEHPETLTSRDNRASVLRGLGRLDEAEAEHRAVLKIRTGVLGEEHPSTLASRDNRASVLRSLGRLDEAEAEHRAVREIRTRVRAEEHRSTLTKRDSPNAANA